VSEKTLVLVKPDGVRRGLVGQILSRFEAKGFTIVAANLRTLDKQTADQHYAEHVEKGWYGELREFITSGPLLSLILEGDQAIVRTLQEALGLFRHQHAHQSKRAKLTKQLHRKFLRLIPFHYVRRNLCLGKLAHARFDLLLFFG